MSLDRNFPYIHDIVIEICSVSPGTLIDCWSTVLESCIQSMNHGARCWTSGKLGRQLIRKNLLQWEEKDSVDVLTMELISALSIHQSNSLYISK